MATRTRKRRKTTPNAILHVSELPEYVLSNVAEYLAKPSRAIFATAMMDAPHKLGNLRWARKPSSTSKAGILTPASGAEWETLDFVDIEKSLAAKLTDDDLDGILVCINASSTLKSLKLNGCFSITGRGLKSLRLSTVLVQLDLSLVGLNESPVIDREPMISERDVLPILNSIVDQNGISLMQVQFPQKFRNNATPALDQFLLKYNEYLRNCRTSCSKCGDICQAAIDYDVIDPPNYMWNSSWISHKHQEAYEQVNYALQDHTCFKCTKSVCMNCRCQGSDEDTIDEDECFMDRCESCNKTLCQECSPVSFCSDDHCGRFQCTGCGLTTCDTCDQGICGQCLRKCECCNQSRCSNCTTFYECKNEDCQKKHCEDCRDDNNNNVTYCLTCGEDICVDCQFTGCSQGLNSCGGCISAVAEKLANDYRDKAKALAPEKCTCRNASSFYSCKTCDFKCKRKDCNETHCSDCGICGNEEDIFHCASHTYSHTYCFGCRVNYCCVWASAGGCKTCMKDVIQKLGDQTGTV